MNTDQPNMLKILSSTTFAEGMPNAHLQCLCRASRIIKFPARAKLFGEGCIEDEVFVVSSGRVELSMFVPGRGQVPFMMIEPGELVGWSGLISDGRMTASATAVEDTSVIALSGKRLQDLCTVEKDLGYVLLKRVAQVLSQRLISTRIQLLALNSGD